MESFWPAAGFLFTVALAAHRAVAPSALRASIMRLQACGLQSGQLCASKAGGAFRLPWQPTLRGLLRRAFFFTVVCGLRPLSGHPPFGCAAGAALRASTASRAVALMAHPPGAPAGSSFFLFSRSPELPRLGGSSECCASGLHPVLSYTTPANLPVGCPKASFLGFLPAAWDLICRVTSLR